MNVYLVVATDQDDITGMVTTAFRGDAHHKLADHLWLVAKKGADTSSEAFKLLYTAADGQSPETPTTRTIIVPVTSYYGYHNVAVWQWINSKQQATS